MDIQTLTSLSAALYDACYDPNAWPQAAQALRASLNSMAATLVVRQGDGYRTVHSDCDDDYAQRYWQEFSAHDPMLTGPGPGHDQHLYCDQMVMDRRHFQQSALFGDWLQPQDRHSILLMKIPGEHGTAAIFAFNRGGSQPIYDTSDVKAYLQIQPLLAHAIGHLQAIERLRALAHGGQAARTQLAHLIVDSQRRILQQDAATNRLLRRHADLLGERHGALCLFQTHAVPELNHAIGQACAGSTDWHRGACLLLRDAAGQPCLALSIAPLHDAGMFGLGGEHLVSITIQALQFDARPDARQHLQLLFGFSPREAELACALVQGLSLQEIALLRHVSLTTVRSQLSCLFRKTGTSRQGQLVALLARLSG
ncbi:helix-turn-helix transcriptional regulator [Castellaniella sp.]|uniref:helix-turn-helix transcriptional regulator n=1 Tax=Castellaniella sp. TaxID=1955812 RepID=UPI002AFF35AC|nr:helix-turn-helix transcriptional regulator [Castellaniella sp.]